MIFNVFNFHGFDILHIKCVQKYIFLIYFKYKANIIHILYFILGFKYQYLFNYNYLASICSRYHVFTILYIIHIIYKNTASRP